MAIVVKFKPKMITARSKPEILNRLRGGYIANYNNHFNHNGSYLVKRGPRGAGQDLVRLYSLEKHNRKVKIETRIITRGKRKGEVEKTVTVIRTAHWVAHYYDLPETMIDKAKQNTRTFTLKTK